MDYLCTCEEKTITENKHNEYMTSDKTTQETQNNGAQNIKARIKKNPIMSAITGAIILIAIIVIGTFAYKSYITDSNNEAATKLAKGQDYFQNGQFDQALNGDNAGYPGFVKIAAQYSSTETGNLANLYAGLSYYHKGDYDKAIKYLESFDAQDDQFISNNGIAALGNCYAKKGNYDKAIELLKKAAKNADNSVVSPSCLVQAGELLEKQNKKAEALELYNEVKSKYPSSTEAQGIDKFIQQVSE